MISIKKIKKALRNLLLNLGDFFIILGLIFITVTTFLINIIVGMYVLGGIFFLLGVYFAFNPLGKG